MLAGEKVTQDELKAAYDKARIALSSTYGQRRDLDFESSFSGFQMIAASLEISQSDLQYWETRLFPAAKVKIGLGDSLKAMQIVCRLDNLKTLRIAVEASCKRMLRPSSDLEAEERGGSFVSMARAVMSVSAADGQAYFDKAVEAVSKFGDEVVYRWEALVVAAKASASDVNCGERTTYRFIRCAEAVGDSVAREKYWNREEVFAVAANMNLPTSLVMLSRWRDRRVGWFSELLSPWIHECVEKNLAEPAVLWSFTGFREMNHLGWIASQCIRKLKDSGIKKKIFQTTVRDLRIIGDLSKLEEILDVAKEFPPDAKAIEELVAREKSSQISSENTKRPEEWSDEKDPKEKMGKLGPILASLDTSNAPSLTEALTKLGQSEPPRESDLFWELVVSKVDSGKEVDFLKAFFKLQRIDVGDAMKVLRLISAASWRGKISVERYWLTFVKRLGAKFPEKFANHYSMVYFNSFYTFSERELDSLAEGISEALSESAGIMPAETYYGFAKSEIARLSPNESLEILEFALARFEIHFPDDEAGGVWTEGFCPPSAREEVVAGFLWAALGSPYSHERWEAAHVVRRLAETSCRKEICALAKLLMTDTAGCFSDPELPFYVLHARLYLLMAFERIVSESPSLLLPYAQSFRQLALEGFPHILIESRAAAISLVLEGKHPGTFDDETFDSLKKVGKSPFPPEFENLSKGYPDTPWHLEGSINLELEYSFEYEFDWYWFEQLSRVFAVSPKQVEQLAAELALKHIDPSKKCDDSDPRRHQFNSGHYSERGTRHSHGRYPKDDSYSFYCSYHSFLSVASLLLSRLHPKQRFCES
ncbi:hypothetical protein OAL23_00470 [bacterium]|nr:hypothetical protein [bacterium]